MNGIGFYWKSWYFNENCNFSVNSTERDRILLENYISMKICNFPINVTERDRILLENLIFSGKSVIFMIFLENCNFSMNISERYIISVENLIFSWFLSNWSFPLKTYNFFNGYHWTGCSLVRKFVIFIKTIIFQAKTPNGSAFHWKICYFHCSDKIWSY